MKMSQYFRDWQLAGELPKTESAEFAFWAGWVLAGATVLTVSFDDRREMAIKACEFIENQK